MKNIDIRMIINDSRLKCYEIASAMGMPETAFSRLITRKELSEDKKNEILVVIADLTGGDINV
jgi:hypothetical protein